MTLLPTKCKKLWSYVIQFRLAVLYRRWAAQRQALSSSSCSRFRRSAPAAVPGCDDVQPRRPRRRPRHRHRPPQQVRSDPEFVRGFLERVQVRPGPGPAARRAQRPGRQARGAASASAAASTRSAAAAAAAAAAEECPIRGEQREEECPICLEVMSEGGSGSMRVLSCTDGMRTEAVHAVCDRCWTCMAFVDRRAGTKRCPLCRQEAFLSGARAGQARP